MRVMRRARTAQEKYDEIEAIKFPEIAEQICGHCPKSAREYEKCDGFLAETCPFDSYIRDLLNHLYEAERVIQNCALWALYNKEELENMED